MRSQTMITLATAALVLTPGCGASHATSEHHQAATQTPGVTTGPFDLLFIDAMVPHHQQALAMAAAARDAGLSNPDLMVIADNVLRSQAAEINQMRAWRDQWYSGRAVREDAATLLGVSHREMGMDAVTFSSPNVDAAFAAAMAVHHRGAIRMARSALDKATHPQLKRLAKAMIAAQQAEMETLRLHAGGM